MKINYLKINGFGKIKNKEINLNNKINLIYGKNESGKSTLLKFITGMFYGLQKIKNGKEISDYDKYLPWSGEEYSGKLDYTLDDETNYNIFRDFSKKNPQIYNEEKIDITKNYEIDKSKGSQFFYEQTQIAEDIFYSTSIVEQQETKLNKQSQNILIQKISNMITSGQEDISLNKTLEKLKQKITDEIGTERTQEKPINIIKRKKEEITKKINILKNYNEEKYEIEKQKNKLEKDLLAQEYKFSLLKQIKTKKEKNNIDQEKIKINRQAEKEYNQQMENLQSTLNKDKIEIPENKLNKIGIIISIILIALTITSAVFKQWIISVLFMILAIIVIVYTINKKLKKEKDIDNIRNENKSKTKDIINQIKIIKESKQKIQKENEELENHYKKQEQLEKDIIKNNYQKIEQQEIEKYLNSSYEEILEYINKCEDKIKNIKIEMHTIQLDEKQVLENLENLALLEEEQQLLQEQEEELLQELKIINLTIETLKQAYEEMKQNITPQFTQNLNQIISKISDGKYTKVKFTDQEGLIVELENGEYINCSRLSIGTIDQMYLSLRLSAIKEVSEETMPIILDETFAYYDNQRLENILKYINQEFSKNQVIIFTCSQREKNILDNLQIEYNLIEL